VLCPPTVADSSSAVAVRFWVWVPTKGTVTRAVPVVVSFSRPNCGEVQAVPCRSVSVTAPARVLSSVAVTSNLQALKVPAGTVTVSLPTSFQVAVRSMVPERPGALARTFHASEWVWPTVKLRGISTRAGSLVEVAITAPVAGLSVSAPKETVVPLPFPT